MIDINANSFDYQDKPVRSVEVDGELWFVAKDVCAVLNINWSGIKGTLSSLRKSWLLKLPFFTSFGTHNLICLNEFGVCKMAFRSTTPESEYFIDVLAGEATDYDVESFGHNNKDKSRKGYVYLMYNPESYLTKIGFSLNPGKRERGLKLHYPSLHLLKAWKGSFNEEQRLQKYFETKNVTGEWFNLKDHDRAFIEKRFIDKNREEYKIV